VLPVFHEREDRIRAHVQLCWFAQLLLSVVENTDSTAASD
jgi:transposase